MNRKILFFFQKYHNLNSIRCLNLHEYQCKNLLQSNGCKVQNFFVASNLNEAKTKITNQHFDEYVIKAQILAGGRRKGYIVNSEKKLCGIHITKSKTETLDIINDMLNKHLVTKQTCKNGVLVKKVMVAESINIQRETYLAVVLDRTSNGPIIIASPEGGVDIEEVAESKPNLILKEPIFIETGVTLEQCERIANFLQFPSHITAQVVQQIQNLYNLFIKIDATQIEINPLVQTSDNKIYCVDAKMNFDDNAQFRQKDIFILDESKEDMDQREIEAKKYNLNYIALKGDIACLVNGAGLAMATMDLIKLKGGNPANFLDVGGTVTEDQVYNAFRILLLDSNIKAIFVNIFGGIVNCVTIANGFIHACERIKFTIPLIVRLEGTNVDEAKKILNECKFPIYVEKDFNNAALRAVNEAKY